MGTLYDRPPRANGLKYSVNYLQDVADELGLKPKTPAEWESVGNIMVAALMLQSADAFDEQLGGFGKIGEQIADGLQAIAEAIRERAE